MTTLESINFNRAQRKSRGLAPVLDSVDWAKPSRDYLALVFQGFVSFIVYDKALDYLKIRSLAAEIFIVTIVLIKYKYISYKKIAFM